MNAPVTWWLITVMWSARGKRAGQRGTHGLRSTQNANGLPAAAGSVLGSVLGGR